MSRSKLSEAISRLDPAHQAIAENVCTEIRFIKTQLSQLRREVREKGAVDHFTNGRQEMDRIAPALQAYNMLVGRYASLHRQLMALLPGDTATIDDDLDEFLSELR